MCGRYLITTAPEALRKLFAYAEQPNFPARYNIAPTQPVPIVRLWEGARQFALVRWGLLPSWVKDPKNFTLLFNARSDSTLDKPAFRNAMMRRRCLFPADGFYEWKSDGKTRRPYAVLPKKGGPVAFAGLWETWMGPNGEEVETAAIITTDANRTLRHIHTRMPAVIPPEAFDLWLDGRAVEAATAAAMLVPAQDELFEAYEIGPAVNRAANDTPDLLLPADPNAAPPEPAPKKRAARGKAPVDDGQGSLF